MNKVVYSECNINANILFSKETKTITCVSNTTTNKRKLISMTLSKSDQSCFNWPLIKWLVVTNCFEIIAYYWYYRRRISNYRKLQPYTPVVPQKIGKYFADFNFRGLILTAKFRENLTTRKFPLYGIQQVQKPSHWYLYSTSIYLKSLKKFLSETKWRKWWLLDDLQIIFL